MAVEAILKNYPPQSHSFHFLLTCVPSGLRKYFAFIFHEAFSPLLSQAELTPESRADGSSQSMQLRAGQEG